MKLVINHQENYSRGELLLRGLFGLLYIDLPHLFLIFFVGLWSNLITFLSMWIILFTGRYPESFFEFQVGFMRWQVRWMSRFYNLSDGYPAFGVNATDEHTSLDIEYPEQISRGLTLARMFFGAFYVILPHAFLLMFMGMWGALLRLISWWIVLFTGSYPTSFHEFNVGLIRWNLRVGMYMGFMTDQYPPFTGKEIDDEMDGASKDSDNSPTPDLGQVKADSEPVEEKKESLETDFMPKNLASESGANPIDMAGTGTDSNSDTGGDGGDDSDKDSDSEGNAENKTEE